MIHSLLMVLGSNYLSLTFTNALSSDHLSVIVTINATIIYYEFSSILNYSRTDWYALQDRVIEQLKTNVRLKTRDDLEHAINQLITTEQAVGCNSLSQPRNRSQNS